jgi:hypothetical protein
MVSFAFLLRQSCLPKKMKTEEEEKNANNNNKQN